jgi:hypothetical protein
LAGSVALAVSSHVSGKLSQEPQSLLVNDIHSQLNSTRVLKIVHASSVEDVQNIVRTARNPVSGRQEKVLTEPVHDQANILAPL